MREATIVEAVAWFERKTAELYIAEPDESRRGIKCILQPRAPAVAGPITLTLLNVPAIDALRYITKCANLDFSVDEEGQVVIGTVPLEPLLFKRTYCVPPKAIEAASGRIHGPDGTDYPTAELMFGSFGVRFPKAALAAVSVDGKILVRNTWENLVIVEVLMAAMTDANGGKLLPDDLELLRRLIDDVRKNGLVRRTRSVSCG